MLNEKSAEDGILQKFCGDDLNSETVAMPPLDA